MKRLDVIIPGLLGPFSSAAPDYIRQQLQQAEYRQINQWLSRAEIKALSADDYFSTLISVISPQCRLGACQLSAEFDAIDISQGYFYRADPVHFRAESDHAVLLGSDVLDIAFEEAEKLIDAFNLHFAEDKISLHAVDANRWYLKSEKPLNLALSGIDYAMGRDIKHFMPKGDDELWWRKIVNEAQMLFFQHSVNECREENRQLGINGLWLWDQSVGPNKQVLDTPQIKHVYTDDAIAASLAARSSINLSSVASFLQQEVEPDSLLVIDELYKAVCYGDLDAWLESLSSVCVAYVAYISSLLKSKKIDVVYVHTCDGRRFEINRLKLLKFWQPQKTLDNYFSVLN